MAEVIGVLNKILNRLDQLEAEMREIKRAKEGLSQSNGSSAVFHSLNEKMREDNLKARKRMEGKLARAADLAILHFERVPPKRRR